MAVFVVTNTNDSGAGSLRAAVEAADAAAGADTVRFHKSLKGQTIVLTSGGISIDSEMTINGDVNKDGKADVTISGNNSSNIFFMSSYLADATVRSLDLTQGYAGVGGAIYVYGDAKLKVVNSTLSGNAASYGGAIGTMYGDVTIVNSLITGNFAYGSGGGVRVNQGKLTMVNTTVHSNEAMEGGGGISTADGELVLTNSTITGNRVTAGGGAGGISQVGTTITIVNSVVAENTSPSFQDVNGTIQQAVNSVFGTVATILQNTNSAINVHTVGLSELLDHGGVVLSRSPMDNSFLIDFGDDASLPLDIFDLDGDGNTTEVLPIDVRGLARLFRDSVDAGAVEWVLNETIRGTSNDNLIFGGAGQDRIYGGSGQDILDGGAGNDRLYGESGNDFLRGGGGNDLLEGGDDNDTLIGGSGDDRLAGGKGLDMMTGNGGVDTFVLTHQFVSRDTLVDFRSGVDVFEIAAASFGAGLTAGALDPNQFVSNNTGLAGDADDRFIYNQLTGELFFDTNGSAGGGSRLIATLTNLEAISASDFMIV